MENEISQDVKSTVGKNKIVVNRSAMNQLQFHETFQLVPKRDPLELVANHLQLNTSVSQYMSPNLQWFLSYNACGKIAAIVVINSKKITI